MKKRNVMHLAVTGALAAIAAQNAFAGIGLKAGDWDLDFGGFVNGFYTYAKCDENVAGVFGGLACTSASNGGDSKSTSVRSGLLPSALIFSAKTRQNNLDVGVTIGFYPGINNVTGVGGANSAGNPTALGSTGIDARQNFFTFGDKSWGTIKIGRDIGIFASNAILSDMTLLGVGSVGSNIAPSNTSLGRIGLGYIYADWQPQITYTSADIGGFQFAGGLFSPLQPSDASFSVHKSPQIQAQVSYAWTGDFGGKAWLSGVSQKVEQPSGPGSTSYTGSGVDAGFKFSVAGFEGVIYGYDGDGIGTTGLFVFSNDALGNKRKSNGGYVQGTYKFGDVKLGLSAGESRLKLASNEVNPSLVKTNRSGVAGVYYSLTKSVNLVAEYADTEAKAQNGTKNKEKAYILGGILFF